MQNGTYFYRLKQIDYDGGIEYSPIIKIINENNWGPIITNKILKMNSGGSSNSLLIYNIQGKLILNKTFENYLEFNLGSLSPGMYYLMLPLHPPIIYYCDY